MFTLFLISKMFCNPFLNAHCSISCCSKTSWDCWGNCVKRVCEFCSSRLKSSTETEDLPRDFLSLTLPARTNLLITSLSMFLELLNHGSWPDILAYKRLQNTSILRLRMFHCDNKPQQWRRLVQQNKLFTQNKIFVRKHQQIWERLFCCFERQF